MTLRIEPSRRHGPFDPRYLARRHPRRMPAAPYLSGVRKGNRSLEETERSKEAHGGVLRAAVQAWEGEGGAVQ
jgi:hypothetical protein